MDILRLVCVLWKECGEVEVQGCPVILTQEWCGAASGSLKLSRQRQDVEAEAEAEI